MNIAENISLELIKEVSSSKIYNWSYQYLLRAGIPAEYAHILNSVGILLAVILFLLIIDFLSRKILKNILILLIQKSETKWDDLLIKNSTLNYACHLLPLLVGQRIIPLIFIGFPTWTNVVNKGFQVFMVINLALLVNSILKTIRDVLSTRKRFADKPIDSYLQVFTILTYSLSAIAVFSILTGSSPWSFFVSLGAASAVLMLVFKDTILGFVASIQVSTNDLLRVGDWVEMPKHNADGDVIEINLNTVKIKNWDMTITSIPTHLLTTESFKNYRGMQASGGRRIKRAIHIKISTIRFLKEEELTELKKITLLKDYIEERQAAINKFNTDHQVDKSMALNGRNLTNIGLLREYIVRYGRKNPNIHQEMLFFVRQLAPTEKGLPLELYMFTNVTGIVAYEGIMSDIFDHVFAAIPYFKLEIFELPASTDIRQLRDLAPQQRLATVVAMNAE